MPELNISFELATNFELFTHLTALMAILDSHDQIGKCLMLAYDIYPSDSVELGILQERAHATRARIMGKKNIGERGL